MNEILHQEVKVLRIENNQQRLQLDALTDELEYTEKGLSEWRTLTFKYQEYAKKLETILRAHDLLPDYMRKQYHPESKTND